jgi:DNA ligase (NAD+)
VLKEKIDIAVRGEIYLPLAAFNRINSELDEAFANPRNLAAGILRRIKSREAAAVPLDIFVYEGFFSDSEKSPSSHVEMLEKLEALGFRINKNTAVFYTGRVPEPGLFAPVFFAASVSEIPAYIEKERKIRSSLPYEIDGLVIKVDNLAERELLGYTGHHPRWALAYKFTAPRALTKIRDIEVQVGRTGRITPVARVEAVLLSGSTISNITLHNQEYIDMLEIAVGDTVEITRRGDVIPAVEKVVEKNTDKNPVYKIPPFCPSCSSKLELSGAHHFCRNYYCPDQIKGRLVFFTGRDQMNIENLGYETVSFLAEQGFVQTAEALYSFDYKKLQDYPGFGEKKVELICQALEKSRKNPFSRLLYSLGLPGLGPKAVELLMENGFSSRDLLLELGKANNPAVLTAIPGIGEITAGQIIESLKRPELETALKKFEAYGFSMQEEVPAGTASSGIFSGQTWCATGSFDNFKPREQALELVKKYGGKTADTVSRNVSHLLAGKNAGSKLEKAQSLGVEIVDEKTFMNMLGQEGNG